MDRCTQTNRQLQKRVESLESENRSLLSQLRKLQSLVTQYHPSRLQAGTLVMVVVLSFSFFFMPQLKHRRSDMSYQTISGESVGQCRCVATLTSAGVLVLKTVAV